MEVLPATPLTSDKYALRTRSFLSSPRAPAGSPLTSDSLLDLQFWTNICSTEITPSERISQVQSLLDSPSKIDLALRFRGPEAQRLIDILDQVSRSCSPSTDGRSNPTQVLAWSRLDDKLWLRGLRLIRNVSKTQRIVPSLLILQEESIHIGKVRFEGGSTVVNEGMYKGRAVAIKRLKMNGGDSDKIFKVLLVNVPNPCRSALA